MVFILTFVYSLMKYVILMYRKNKIMCYFLEKHYIMKNIGKYPFVKKI